MKSLREAAQAVCDRWDTPAWKDVEPTAVFIGELRAAIAREEAQSVVPAGVVFSDRVVELFLCIHGTTTPGVVDTLRLASAHAFFEIVTKHPAHGPTQVTCQIYGHVVGACGECNAEADVNATNAKLASNYLELVAKVEATAKQPLISERKELIKELHLVADRIEHCDAGIDSITCVLAGADMLAADAEELSLYQSTLESRERNIEMLVTENKRLEYELQVSEEVLYQRTAKFADAMSAEVAGSTLVINTMKQTIAELEDRVEACEYATNSIGLRKQIAAITADKQELETELARVKAKWQDDYLTLNDVCNQQIKLEHTAKLALLALVETSHYNVGSIAQCLSKEAIKALKKVGI